MEKFKLSLPLRHSSIFQPTKKKAAPEGRLPYGVNRNHAANAASSAANVVRSMSIVTTIFIGLYLVSEMARC